VRFASWMSRVRLRPPALEDLAAANASTPAFACGPPQLAATVSCNGTGAGAAACDAGSVSARIGEVAYAAELHRLRGVCAPKHSLAAQRDFETAVRIARAQGCRGYESRAAASLASLGDRQAAD